MLVETVYVGDPLYSVWTLTASMEVKNKHAYVITQDISRPNRLLQDLTTMSLIILIPQRFVN